MPLSAGLPASVGPQPSRRRGSPTARARSHGTVTLGTLGMPALLALLLTLAGAGARRDAPSREWESMVVQHRASMSSPFFSYLELRIK